MAEVAGIFLQKGTVLLAYVELSTMAMGDCSACEYAQCSHLSVLRGHGVFTEAQLNTSGSSLMI